jgi:mannose-6-phosphate isomerase
MPPSLAYRGRRFRTAHRYRRNEVQKLTGSPRHYEWGSVDAIPGLTGEEGDGRPLAELWFGAHEDAPATTENGQLLSEIIADDPAGTLGADVVDRFGSRLPYLLKLIAPAAPLSLQVHPDLQYARQRFAAEDAEGIPLTSPERNYRDANHKPEMVFALTTFEAVCGFRAPRRTAELFADLEAPLAKRVHHTLKADPSAGGVRAAFTDLLTLETRPDAAEVQEFADACAARLLRGSPSPRADSTVVRLAEEYPGDPGVVASLLLNPVTLQPGETLFVPAGGVHAYLSGLAVEVMASSDNVLRAGLTKKHVDIPEMLRCVDFVAAPPIRLAPEVFHGATRVFYAPVDDFELSVTDLEEDGKQFHPLPGRGPRIVLCLEGEVVVRAAQDEQVLSRGEALFVGADEGNIAVQGKGRLVQSDVP